MHRVFIKLAFATTADSLLRLCRPHADVCGVWIVKDEAGYSRGIGFVDVSTFADAVRLIEEINGRVYEGHRLIADHARPKAWGGTSV